MINSERLNQITSDYEKRLARIKKNSSTRLEDILELLNNDKSELTENDCEEFFDAFENPCDKVDNLVSLMDRCKLLASENQSKAEEYSETSKLWERRLQKLQGYGIRLLNKQPMHSLESDEYILGLDQEMPKLKSSVTRRYMTEHMISDELIFSVPEVYRQPRIVWEMRSDYVRDTLISGKKLSFAKLIDKQRLRILNKSEENYADQ